MNEYLPPSTARNNLKSPSADSFENFTCFSNGAQLAFVPGENAVDANPSNDAHKLKYKMNSNHLYKSVQHAEFKEYTV